jgi:hypothetical protein
MELMMKRRGFFKILAAVAAIPGEALSWLATPAVPVVGAGWRVKHTFSEQLVGACKWDDSVTKLDAAFREKFCSAIRESLPVVDPFYERISNATYTS